jgi:uncharacterized protein
MTQSQEEIDFTNACIKPSEVDYVIYHANCSDGFGSALCAYKYFKDSNLPQPIYYGAKFGVLPKLDDVKDKNVLICDFSYKKDILDKLLLSAKNLLILDHHKTSKDDLKELPIANKVFRMDHSGAYITWVFFFGSTNVPLGILYIEDNDIWKKELPNTYEFTAFVASLPFTFEAYEKLLDNSYVLMEAIPQGIGMAKQNNVIVTRAIKYAVPKFIQVSDKYYFVAYLNASELKSELGNKVFIEYPLINFSVIYSHNDSNNSTSFSLRSLDTATDVSEIAKIYGGGGHRNASGAGSNCIINTLPCITIDSSRKSYHLLENIYTGCYTIDNIDYHVVYLNSSHFKHQLAKYLLQTRYTTTDNQQIQECVSIMTKMKITSVKSVYDMSIVWNYDGFRNCTWMTVCFKNDLIKDKIIKLVKEDPDFISFDNPDLYDDVITFSLRKLKQKIEY